MGNVVIFHTAINPIPDGRGRNHLFAPYRLNYSLTDLMTDLPMVCKFKFVLYGHIKKKLALYAPRFNSDGPHFLPLDPNFVLDLEPII